MLTPIRNWLDNRTGCRKLVDALLLEHIPGGARWRYVWGSTLMFVFSIQLVTGLLLMTSYSPGDSTAWSSVYYIQYEMDFGWLIRGLHHFGSQTMVVLLACHMLQVVIAGAHLPPREITWWLGLGLMGCVLGLSLTGYLLPWDQKGYYATQVATNIAGNLPIIGPFLQKVVVGGPAYGHHTLTRFFTLHVAVLPGLIALLLGGHLALVRRHGVTPRKRDAQSPDGLFWPDQVFRDLLVCMAIFAVMICLVYYGHGQPARGVDEPIPGLYERLAHAGRDGLGAGLDAPADPSRPYPARPEWYFLFLFQLLKYFEGEHEIYGTLVIPNGAFLVLFLLPLLGYGFMRKVGHLIGVLFVVALLTGAAGLTCAAWLEDYANADSGNRAWRSISELYFSKLGDKAAEAKQKATAFRAEQSRADELAKRAVELAHTGIPTEGGVFLLRRDPRTRGPELFAQSCSGCHPYGAQIRSAKPSAMDLHGFGTSKWIEGLLQEPESTKYFGATKLKTMSNWVKRTREAAKKKNAEPALNADFDAIAKWLGGHPRAPIPDEADQSESAKGFRAFDKHCASCHGYMGLGGGSNPPAPDFTGYGDADWLRVMLMAPADASRYGNRNMMPAFRDLESPSAVVLRLEHQRQKQAAIDAADDDTKKEMVEAAHSLSHLSDIDRELIIRWLTGDSRVIMGGEPIAELR